MSILRKWYSETAKIHLWTSKKLFSDLDEVPFLARRLRSKYFLDTLCILSFFSKYNACCRWKILFQNLQNAAEFEVQKTEQELFLQPINTFKKRLHLNRRILNSHKKMSYLFKNMLQNVAYVEGFKIWCPDFFFNFFLLFNLRACKLTWLKKLKKKFS